MDSSLHSAQLAEDEVTPSLAPHHDGTAEEVAEEEHHIHLPGPSFWPILLSVAILVTVCGLMFLPEGIWFSLFAGIFVLIGIMGWALEDPMAPPKKSLILSPEAASALIGRDVLDKNGTWIGTVQARLGNYLLVDNGELVVKAFYVPLQFLSEGHESAALQLTISEADLLRRGLDRVPEDVYMVEEATFGVPQVTGIPLYASKPLSPAETGHYNYGPNFPGINTDAAGSYRPEEVRPIPQKYVADRRNLRLNRKPVAPRVVTSN